MEMYQQQILFLSFLCCLFFVFSCFSRFPLLLHSFLTAFVPFLVFLPLFVFVFFLETIIRKVLNLRAERLEAAGNMKAAEQALKMLEMVQGNIGFVFVPTDQDVGKIREEITSERVQTAAKAGISAPDDVVVPAGPTGQDPSQTSFFQVSPKKAFHYIFGGK